MPLCAVHGYAELWSANLQNWPFCKVRTAHNGALLLGPKHG
jgi:hypothetical protein